MLEDLGLPRKPRSMFPALIVLLSAAELFSMDGVVACQSCKGPSLTSAPQPPPRGSAPSRSVMLLEVRPALSLEVELVDVGCCWVLQALMIAK